MNVLVLKEAGDTAVNELGGNYSWVVLSWFEESEARLGEGLGSFHMYLLEDAGRPWLIISISRLKWALMWLSESVITIDILNGKEDFFQMV